MSWKRVKAFPLLPLLPAEEVLRGSPGSAAVHRACWTHTRKDQEIKAERDESGRTDGRVDEATRVLIRRDGDK